MNDMTNSPEIASFRLPPHSIEAEQSILGGLMIANEAWDRISGLVGEADFYRDDHRQIWRAISRLIEANKPADVLTVSEALKAANKLDQIGGFAYMQDLVNGTLSATNIRHYAEIVRDRAILRGLARVGEQIADAGYSGGSANDRLADAERMILELSQTTQRNRPKHVNINETMSMVMEDLDSRAKNPGALLGISSGFSDLDDMTSGLRQGDLIIVAGRPSMGKTAFAMNVAETVALSGLPALVFSLEMSAKQLTERVLSSVSRVDSMRMRSGRMEAKDWDKLNAAIAKLNQCAFDIDDTGGLTVAEMRIRARRMVRARGGVGVIVVDYLQLMASDGNENRATELGVISSGLKSMAKEFNCPVIALSQLNRTVETRVNKRPVMSDLRESGAIEQDADLILFPFRPEAYAQSEEERQHYQGHAELIIAKQRNGPIGTIPLTFINHLTRFENAAGRRPEPFKARSGLRDGE